MSLEIKMKSLSINVFTPFSLLFYGVVANAALLPVVDDSFVNDFAVAATHGDQQRIVINQNQNSTGYVKFDITALSILENADEVDLAILKLWVQDVDTAGSVEIYAIDANWDEVSLNASNAPILSGAPVATFDVTSGASNDFLLVNITDQVRAWVDAPEINYGIALISAGAGVELDSKESRWTAHEMVIDVVFRGLEGPRGEQGLTGAQGSQGIHGLTGDPGPKNETECKVCVQITSNSIIDGPKECSGYSFGGNEKASSSSKWAEAGGGSLGGGKYASKVWITCRQKQP